MVSDLWGVTNESAMMEKVNTHAQKKPPVERTVIAFNMHSSVGG